MYRPRTSQFCLAYSYQGHVIVVTKYLPAPNRNLEPSSEGSAVTDINSLAVTLFINSSKLPAVYLY
jgi:hypothetical protein